LQTAHWSHAFRLVRIVGVHNRLAAGGGRLAQPDDVAAQIRAAWLDLDRALAAVVVPEAERTDGLGLALGLTSEDLTSWGDTYWSL